MNFGDTIKSTLEYSYYRSDNSIESVTIHSTLHSRKATLDVHTISDTNPFTPLFSSG